MPLYEYECEQCGTRFEVLQRIGATGDELECPECGVPKPKKVFSLFAPNAGGTQSSGRSCGSGGFT